MKDDVYGISLFRWMQPKSMSKTVSRISTCENTLNNKQDLLTFDSRPIENSQNLVISGGVYSALKNNQSTPSFNFKFGSPVIYTESANSHISNSSTSAYDIYKIDYITGDLMNSFGKCVYFFNPSETVNGVARAEIPRVSKITITEYSSGLSFIHMKIDEMMLNKTEFDTGFMFDCTALCHVCAYCASNSSSTYSGIYSCGSCTVSVKDGKGVITDRTVSRGYGKVSGRDDTYCKSWSLFAYDVQMN